MRLHQFENRYFAEIRRYNGTDWVCCCEDFERDTCKSSLNEFSQNTTCDSDDRLCDTFFKVKLLGNQDFATCPAGFLKTDVFTNRSTITDLNYDFQIFLSDAPSGSVRMSKHAQEW